MGDRGGARQRAGEGEAVFTQSPAQGPTGCGYLPLGMGNEGLPLPAQLTYLISMGHAFLKKAVAALAAARQSCRPPTLLLALQAPKFYGSDGATPPTNLGSISWHREHLTKISSCQVKLLHARFYV